MYDSSSTFVYLIAATKMTTFLSSAAKLGDNEQAQACLQCETDKYYHLYP